MHIVFEVGNMDQKKAELKPIVPNFYTKLHQNLFHDSENQPSLQNVLGFF